MKDWKRMTRFGLCALAIAMGLTAIPAAFAQDQSGPPPDGMGGPPPDQGGDGQQGGRGMNVDKQLASMAKRYNLSDDQKTKIRPVLADTQQKMDAIFHDSSLAPEDRFSKVKQIHDDESAKISALLTDDQRAKYQQDQKRRQRQSEDGQDGLPPPPDGDGPSGGAAGGPPPGM
jgi:Spy/CpxP family protein refolding chaperone